MFKSRFKFFTIMMCISVLLLGSTLIFCANHQNLDGDFNIVYTAPKASQFLTYSDNGDGTLTVTGYDETLAQGETKLVIPGMHDGKPVEEITASAFRYNSQFLYLSMENGVKTIGTYAFAQSKLKSIELPNSLIEIGERAFHYCKSLSGKVIIPDSVQIVGRTAFYQCSAITSVTIGSGVLSVGAYAFEGCTSIKEFIIDSQTIYESLEAPSSSLTDPCITKCKEYGGKIKILSTLTGKNAYLDDSWSKSSTLETIGEKTYYVYS